MCDTSGTFSVEKGAQVKIQDNSYIGIATAGTMNINGDITLSASAAESIAAIRGTGLWSPTLQTWREGSDSVINLNSSAKITVESGNATGYGVINGPEVNINGATITVKSGGNLFLDGTSRDDKKIVTDVISGTTGSGSAGIFTMTSGTIDVQDGATILIGQGTYAKDNATTQNVDESKLVTTLNIQGGQLTGTGTVEVRGNLNIADTVFTGFMGANGGKGHLTLSGTNATDLGRTITITGSNQIDLAAYDFSTNANHEISVMKNATIKGNNLAVSSKLTDNTDADAGVSDKLRIEADNLTLGNAKEHNSGALGFSGATAENVTFLDSGEFELHDDLNLYAIKDITNPFDADQTKFQYAKEGTIKGKVNLADSTKPLNIHAGHYTNDYAMTLSGGKLQIGGTTDPEDKGYGVDVSLTQNGDLNLKGGTIVVASNGDVEFDATHERPTEAVLNIRNAQLTVSGSDTTLTADGGTIMVTEAQVGKLLGVENSDNSASITLSHEGELNINGRLQGANHKALDVNKLQSGTATSGMIGFDGDGTVRANSIWLQASGSTDLLNIGNDGTLIADDILLDQESLKTGSESEYDNFVVAQGTLVAGKSVSSSHNNAIVLGDGTLGANLALGYPTPNTDEWGLEDGSYSHSADTGSVSQDLILNGGVDEANRSNLGVFYGRWNAQNITITNGALEIGAIDENTDKYGNPQLLKDSDGNPLTASLTGKNLSLNAGAAVAINENGKANFETFDMKAGTVTIDGQMSVDGKYTAASGEGDKATKATYGVAITGGAINVTGTNAQLSFGADAVKAIDVATTKNDSGKYVTVASGTFMPNISVRNQATLNLDFASGITFNKDSLEELRRNVLSNSTNGQALTDGYIYLGGAEISGVATDGNLVNYDELQRYFQDIKDIKTQSLNNSTLINVDGTEPVKANIGNIRANGNLAEIKLGDSTLNNAWANNASGSFIFNEANNGAPIAATIVAGATVSLENGGSIGNTTLLAGSVGDPTTLIVKSGDKETIVSGSLTANSGSLVYFAQGKSTVTGAVNADELRVDQNLEVKGNTTVNTLTSTVDSTTKLPVKTGNITATNLTVNKDVVYGGSITATGDVKIAGGLNADADKDNPITAGKLTAKNLTVGGETNYFGDMEISEKATFGGKTSLIGNNSFKDVDIEAAGTFGFYAMPNADGVTPAYNTSIETLTFKGDGTHKLEIEDGVTLSAGVIQGLKADNTSTAVDVSVGTVSGSDTEDSWDASTGYLMADRIDLAGGSLRTDPDYGQAASIATVGRLGAAAKADSVDAGSLNGNVFALQNSIIALGVDNKTVEGKNAIEQVQDTFADYLNKDTLSLSATGDNAMGAILYVAKPLTVEKGSKLVADANTTNNTLKAAIASKYDGVDAYIGTNSAIAVNATSAQQIDADGKVVSAAVTFDRDDAKVYADKDAKIVLVGNFDITKPVKVFTDTDGKVELASGSTDTITVTSAKGLYKNTIAASEDGVLQDIVNLELTGKDDNGNGDTPNPWAGVSTPVYETLKAYDTFLGEHPEYDYDSDFLYYALQKEEPAAAEKVARLGAYGGAAQAAIAAGSTTYEAVSGHMGVGANGTNITVADNTQGAALWLTPVYKNRDSDGFGADGVDYGTDLDLYGVALGADYTLANGVKIGAAFNIGSGDADGNGAGEGVSNDFDYYGFAIYGGYTYGPYSVVADISYTTVDNDVDATTSITGVGKVGTSFDSSSLSVGVTGQYQAILDGDVSVTPHAGLRYTKIDLDDYTVHGEKGDVAAYSSDDLSIFSIPFGVTVAKEFVNGTWTVKPSFDLTLTANFGDDSADGSVDWGVDGLKHTAVSSEVLDNFTYGATVGVAAKSGNFSLGFGLNYTGSSNTDEFGVNANARFVF